ncbi:MAG: transposase, partial [Bacillota bacterium]
LDEPDYCLYLSLLEKYSSRHGVTVHAYALLPNHLHLLVQVSTRPLSLLMHVLQQTYTQAFNRKYGRVGHLFQGRYKALVVEDDAYLLSLVKYIHMNPVEAGLCADPSDYPWSSHRHYLQGGGAGKVETAFIMSVMAQFGGREIDGYTLLPRKSSTHKHSPTTASEQTAGVTSQGTISLDELLLAVSAVSGVAPAAVTSPCKERAMVKARRLFVYCAAYLGGHKMADIASFLGKSGALISIAASDVSEGLRHGDGKWDASIRGVEARLGGGN